MAVAWNGASKAPVPHALHGGNIEKAHHDRSQRSFGLSAISLDMEEEME
jgi:hypothetical protein